MSSAARKGEPWTVALDDVRAGDRIRHDLGDVEALAASIKARGLLQPIAVGPDMELIAGARRIAAFRLLGRERIPCHVVSGLDDAAAMLRAERDENTERKDFTPSEKVALGQRLEALERPRAAERKRAGKAPSENFTEGRGETRDRVGAAIGMSGPTYEKAKAVVAAAEAEPERFGALVEEMDRAGKVDGAFKKLAAEAPRSAPAREREFDSDREAQRVRDWNLARAREWPREKRPLLANELELLANKVRKGIIG